MSIRGIWLDAQLAPSMARWMTDTFGVPAQALRDLGLRDAFDTELFDAARTAGVVVLTKDADFVELLARLGPPPQVVWLRCGNTSKETAGDLVACLAGRRLSAREG